MKWIFRILALISIAFWASMGLGNAGGCYAAWAAMGLAYIALGEIMDIREQMTRR